ncbi:MAG: hypothetical protein PHV48_04850, partial [Candidatus Omnitrophica bacterium]|nr:hypothetical protein [Candidatus Omnitrophota bacterium]
MKNSMTMKIVSVIVLCAFLVNDLAYGLGTMPGSTQTQPGGTVEEAFALGQKRFAANVGPGVRELTEAINAFKAPAPEFFPKEIPKVPGVKFVEVNYNRLPKGWENNGIYKIEDIKEAFEYFHKNEARIPDDLLPIEVGTFTVEEGQLPFTCIENRSGRHVLVIHKDFVRMWNDLRKNDVWFEHTFPDGEKRTLSLAWGIFYRAAKHEMGDISKITSLPKSLGHFNYYPGLDEIQFIGGSPEDELRVNLIKGRYNILNDAMWAWLLGSYCFNDNTRYNNVTLKDRLTWFFDGRDAQERKLNLEFPNLLVDRRAREDAIQLALGINYKFFHDGKKVEKIRKSEMTEEEGRFAQLIDDIARGYRGRNAPLEGIGDQKIDLFVLMVLYRLNEHFDRAIQSLISDAMRGIWSDDLSDIYTDPSKVVKGVDIIPGSLDDSLRDIATSSVKAASYGESSGIARKVLDLRAAMRSNESGKMEESDYKEIVRLREEVVMRFFGLESMSELTPNGLRRKVIERIESLKYEQEYNWRKYHTREKV